MVRFVHDGASEVLKKTVKGAQKYGYLYFPKRFIGADVYIVVLPKKEESGKPNDALHLLKKKASEKLKKEGFKIIQNDTVHINGQELKPTILAAKKGKTVSVDCVVTKTVKAKHIREELSEACSTYYIVAPEKAKISKKAKRLLDSLGNAKLWRV